LRNDLVADQPVETLAAEQPKVLRDKVAAKLE
jgi:hypothetical protein